MFNSIHKFTLVVGLTAGLLSCGDDHNDTGTEFAPNMYNSVGYEPMTQLQGDTNKINPYGMNMRLPVAGTVSRKKYTGADSIQQAFLAQELLAKTVPNDSLSYSAALLKNPLAATPENIEAGKLQYERFCQHCHGEGGKGDGLVAKQYKGVPVYSSDALKDVNDGHIYHVITHGKGRMWPHGSQISSENRWKIVLYVHELQKQ
ncbi:c-type cytochrome [Aquirufa antheringensis]|jgi:mono/diheme cytochrome c family protein|uniref:Cytochrome c n=1 Tax=Aquirufa antheringensis TaxID=2516559 RepID=A0A4Q9BDW6_9BACT|nr:cytochrome c [Aquirufa antheringensis]MCZ2487497.1 cytochrome c [Aquirufa antheringensis]MCZ2489678.1 cytochrome c [Aquirufa antheringensis]TBH72353.1 cytochrome c [Aquirufa antheringensis]TBH74164.1 cytochrome c [Aquirufa antheringensis]USQ02765.1 cytochrome c [Aquirufa antheringensis]